MSRGGALAMAVGAGALLVGAVVLALRSDAPSSSKGKLAPAIPDGWTRYRGIVTPALRSAAQVALSQERPIGSIVELRINGRTFGAFMEWHYDKVKGRHRGVSLLIPRVAA
jgi:hypothetical protein